MIFKQFSKTIDFTVFFIILIFTFIYRNIINYYTMQHEMQHENDTISEQNYVYICKYVTLFIAATKLQHLAAANLNHSHILNDCIKSSLLQLVHLCLGAFHALERTGLYIVHFRYRLNNRIKSRFFKLFHMCLCIF